GDPALAVGTNIGSYYDHQYLVLDTPQILVPTATPTLTFKLKYNLEDPAGATAPYNGWDSGNVRISVDNGATWTPISGTPAYTFTSSYAFGFEHGEGPNIPAWGGVSNGWVTANFPLTAYAGQNVKIRFAFASDPAYSTGDAPAMFGMMVDDIALGSYSNNGVNDGQMTWASMVPTAGDLWNIATVTGAPSPTHVYACQNAQLTYVPNMMNYLVSPPIQLPSSGDIRADFMYRGSFTDPNTFPEVDYMGWEITVNNGITWFAMSNPYGDPNGLNYVYSDAPADWSSFTATYTVDGYITNYAGQTVQFRWFFKSDADTPVGEGIMIDDFTIYNDIFLAEPSNLAATVVGANVELSWSDPGGGGQPGWLHYDSGTNSDAIGLTAGGAMEVAAKWAASGTNSILPYVGMDITQVKFFPNVAGVTYTIKIYNGPTGTEVYSQAVTNPVIGDWNTITLTTPYTIPSGQYVWVGYSLPHAAGQYPAGIDAGPAVAGFGDMIKTSGGWSSLYDASSGSIDGNWNIQAYVTDRNGNPVLIQPVNTPNRNITEFKIYRDDAFIASVLPTVHEYTDVDVAGGLHTYKVTAMYGTNESLPSNVVTVFVVPAGYAEIGYDDGTSEMGYTVGSANMMAVKFQHNFVPTLKYVKLYVASVGNSPMIIRVFDDNGPDGLPGATHLTQFTYAATSIVQGWNYIPIPTGSDITIDDGIFYIAIYEYSNASTIGLDTSQNGHSWKKTAAGWEAITNGEIMLHIIVENGASDADDQTVVPVVMAASNYPNPFSAETTISYSVPKDGMAQLTVYNTKGQVVRTLAHNNVKAGNFTATWNGKDESGNSVANGIYFLRLDSNNQRLIKKMLLSK
ncbi:MAG: FlgD immunoglobulin-like domain containing protein, partial [Candidatus Cloacimonadaceae bacterium]